MPTPGYPVTPGFPLSMVLTTNDSRSPLRANGPYCKRFLFTAHDGQNINVKLISGFSVTVTVYGSNGTIMAQATGQNILIPGPTTNYFLTFASRTSYILEVAGTAQNATGGFTLDLEPFWDDPVKKSYYSVTPLGGENFLSYPSASVCLSDGTPYESYVWSIPPDRPPNVFMTYHDLFPSEPWIHMTPSVSMGFSTLFWAYTADPNPSPSPREGTISVGGNISFVVYQQGGGVDTAQGNFRHLPHMGSPRAAHTCTLLPGGKVLVAGGADAEFISFAGTPFLSTSEIYNPVLQTWSATAPMSGVRGNHTATLLPNGKVLVAGGRNGLTSYLASAELYNPTNATWVSAGSFTTARCYHTATLLPNGKVLIAGGASDVQSFASAALYNPTNGTWTATASMHSPRYAHTATLLYNGKVMVAGGSDDNDVTLSSVELYDPATGTWTFANSTAASREFHTATLLQNGKVLIAAGFNANTLSNVITAELYNPTNGTWSAAGSLKFARDTHTATLLQNGKVLVVDGELGDQPLSTCELFDPASGTWTLTDGLSPACVAHAATILTNGQVLVTGGALDEQSLVESTSVAAYSAPSISASVTLSNLYQVYNGAPRTVSAVTSPAGLNVGITYNGLMEAPSKVGSYAVSATINDSAYQGSTTNTLVILPAAMVLNRPRIVGGTFKLNFARIPGTNYNVLTSTNPALAIANWAVAGQATEISPGQYEFTTSVVGTRRFFRVVDR